MSRSVLSLAAILSVALAVSACTSSRLTGYGQPVQVASVAPIVPEMEPVEAVPTGPMDSSPLPPLDGSGGVMMGQTPGTEVAGLPPASAPAGPTGRSAMVGTWSARDASGSSCRVQLSSSPALDLYRASATGCANKDLAGVNAWDYRDGEVYLYQRGGSVAARLRTSGSGLDGVLAKSGAPVSMSR